MTPEVAIGQRASDRPDSATRWLVIGLTASPLFWFLGFHLFWFHLVAVLAFLALQANDRSTRPDGILVILPLTYVAVYAIGIGMSALDADAPRVAAAFYNLSYWVMGTLVSYVAAASDWRVLRGALVQFGLVLGKLLFTTSVFAIALWAFTSVRTLVLPTPLAFAGGPLNGIQLFFDSTHLALLTTDYLSAGMSPRITLLGPYPVATAALIAMSMPFAASVIAPNNWRKFTWRSVTLLISATGMIAGLWLTNSRTVIAAVLISYGLAFVVARRVFVVTLFVGAIVLLIASPWFMELVQAIAASREGSTVTRVDLYRLELQQIIAQPTLFGFGVKERISEFAIPLGSHSTILGAFYKAGLVGGTLIVGQMALVTFYWFRAAMRIRMREERSFIITIGAGILAMNFVLFTEDLDAPQLMCFFYFLLQGALVATVRSATQRVKVLRAR